MPIQPLTTAMEYDGELSLQRRPNARQFAFPKVKVSVLLLVLSLLIVLFLSTAHQTAFADTTSGNTTQISSTTSSASSITVTFDITTTAVVSFVLVLLGLAASFILMARYANPEEKTTTT